MITEIRNLVLTITLAKSSIIKPAIPDDNVLSEQPTVPPIASLLKASSVKVLQTESIVHIKINYPLIKLTNLGYRRPAKVSTDKGSTT